MTDHFSQAFKSWILSASSLTVLTTLTNPPLNRSGNKRRGKASFYARKYQGRIVDLSPSTAKEIGIDHQNGVARVEVDPIVVPLGDGRVKLGAAAAETSIEASND